MQHFINIFIGILVTFGLPGCSVENNQNLIQTDVYFIEDKSNKLSILDLLYSNFSYHPVKKNPIELGRSPYSYWLYFDLDSETLKTTNHDYCIAIDRISGGETEMFVTTPDDSTHALSSINDYVPTYCLSKLIVLEGSYRFHLRVKHSQELVYLYLLGGSYSEVINTEITKKFVIFGLLVGGFITMVLYHLVLMISTKDPGYSNIVVFSSVFSYLIIIRHGLLPEEYFFNQFGFFISPILPLVILIVALEFLKFLLDNDKSSASFLKKWLDRYVCFIMIMMPIVVMLPQGVYYSYVISLLSAVPVAIIIIYSSLQVNNHIGEKSKDYSSFVAVFGFAITVLPWVFMQLEWISVYTHAEVILYIGALLVNATIAVIEIYRTRSTHRKSIHMEAANAAKDSFLMTMSHELRTPIHTVLGMRELLSQTQLDEKQYYYVKQIGVATHHVLDMVDDVLDLTRIHNDKPNFNYVPFLLSDLLYKVEGIFLSASKKKGLNFNIRLTGNSNISLYGDQKRLSQVIINLIGNALKFTEQGSITLYVDIQTYNEETSNYQIYFAVEDTGIGISQNAQKYLFQAFYQEQSERNRRFQGTGLGLAISAQLVAYMGGELTVRSELERGSYFSFTLQLPCHQEVSQAIDTREVEPASIEDVHILLVDDDTINASLGQMLLASKGAIVDIVNSGQEAIASMAKRSFDIILMDVSMPIMDGYEATSHIRNLPMGDRVPIIALTAHAIKGERERCLAAGMNDYLTKPYSTDDIVAKVHHWLT